MQLMYNETRMDALATIKEASTVDAAGGRMDSLRLRLENSADWMNWAPAENDRVQLTDSGYDTGTMYVDAFENVGEQGYLLLARSCPRKSEPIWACYENASLAELAAMAASEQGVSLAMYGTDGAQRYERIVRRKEDWPAFLNRLAVRESIALKYSGGKLLLIDWEWAMAQDAAMRVEMTADRKGTLYAGGGITLRAYRVKGLYGEGMATDQDAAGSRERVQTCEPVFDGAQAARWARGLLLAQNMGAEKLRMDMALTTGIAALAKIEISGLVLLKGEWMVTLAEHDFAKQTTRLTMNRCRRNIS